MCVCMYVCMCVCVFEIVGCGCCLPVSFTELAMEAQTLRAQYDTLTPAAFARHEQALSLILTPFDWLNSTLAFHRNMPVLQRLIAGDAFVEAMEAVEENCAKQNPPIVADNDDESDSAETQTKPDSSSVCLVPIKGIELHKDFSSRYARQMMDQLRQVALREGSADGASANPPLAGSLSIALQKYQDSLVGSSSLLTSKSSAMTRKKRKPARRKSSTVTDNMISSLSSIENPRSTSGQQSDSFSTPSSPSAPPQPQPNVDVTRYLQSATFHDLSHAPAATATLSHLAGLHSGCNATRTCPRGYSCVQSSCLRNECNTDADCSGTGFQCLYNRCALKKSMYCLRTQDCTMYPSCAYDNIGCLDCRFDYSPPGLGTGLCCEMVLGGHWCPPL